MGTETFVTLMQDSIRSNWSNSAFSDFEGKTITFGELAVYVAKLHEMFKVCGIKKGDKIALIGRNQSNWAVVYLATVSYGAVIVPVLPDFSTNDMHHIVNHSDSKLLFLTDFMFDKVDESKMPALKGIVALKDFHIVYKNSKCNLLNALEIENEYIRNLSSDTFVLNNVSLDDIAVISYTSGTSGFSKGVVLPHRSIWSNARVGWDINIGLKPGDKIVSFLPLAHAYGCLFEFLTPFLMGCHITFLTRTPSPQVITKAFRDVKPNLILSVPLIIEKVYKKQILPAIDKRTMKVLMRLPVVNSAVYKKINAKLTEVFGGEFSQIIIGGAALNKEVERFLRRIGFKFTVGYGMTECGPLISYQPYEKHVPESAGKVVPRMQVRIDSADPMNVPGEIQIKGDNVMLGYYKNDEATNEVFTADGWLRSGDLGVMNSDGVIFIKGRSKNMILGPSGQNIYPEEIEAQINNMPFVQESLVRENNGKLEALVYPDLETADAQGMTIQQVEQIVKAHRDTLNKILPLYMNISKISLYPVEFEKTPKKSIKRYLYTLNN